MLGFGKKKPAPPLCPANPGVCTDGKFEVTRDGRTSIEKFNAVSLAASVLRRHGHSTSKQKTFLEHRASGFLLSPQLVAAQPLDTGAVQTVTTIQLNHPTLAPDGLFEYQHFAGETLADSIAGGFDQWVQTDFVTLLDALRPTPQTCTLLELEFPAKNGNPPLRRRAVLGPVAHLMADTPDQADEEEEHPFCPCCLLTRSFEAFQQLIESDAFYGLRLFAARDEDGAAEADCRVNGEDFEPGMEALRKYAATWAPAGYEFRKQYVVVQTME